MSKIGNSEDGKAPKRGQEIGSHSLKLTGTKSNAYLFDQEVEP
jgi:hypothetical protein